MEFKDMKDELKKLEKMYIPNDEKTAYALGDIKKEIRNERVRVVFSDYVVKNFHNRMKIESPDEWIPSTQQESQNYDGYTVSGYNDLYQDRKTIYIQPLDKSITEEFLEECKMYCEAFFFGLPVVIRNTKDVKLLKVKTRGEGKHIQYNAREILNKVEKWLPDDAYCMLCIINKDLYHREDWNFVFGLGAIRFRTGVFSFARYDPSFFDEDHEESEHSVKEIITYRSIRVMIHEIGHMFGLLHCVYYQCCMNGSMSAEEGSKRPSYLCPICLRKLWYNIGFDPLERFKALTQATTINDCFQKDHEWYKSMVEHLETIYEEKKLVKPFVKRYPKNDPNKPNKNPPKKIENKSKQNSKTGITKLIEERKQKKEVDESSKG